MASPFKTTKSVIFISIYLVCILLGSAALIAAIHENTFAFITSRPLLRSHLMCGFFGALGASLSTIRKLYQSCITHHVVQARGEVSEASNPLQSWGFGWGLYFASRPLVGAAIGALTYLLSFIGFPFLSKSSDPTLSDQARYVLFGVSCLGGFSVSHVLDKMAGLSKPSSKRRGATTDYVEERLWMLFLPRKERRIRWLMQSLWSSH